MSAVRSFVKELVQKLKVNLYSSGFFASGYSLALPIFTVKCQQFLFYLDLSVYIFAKILEANRFSGSDSCLFSFFLNFYVHIFCIFPVFWFCLCAT